MTNPDTLDKALDIIREQQAEIARLNGRSEADERWHQEQVKAENYPGFHKPWAGAGFAAYMREGRGFDLT